MKTYEKYRESKFQWIRNYPLNWNIIRLRYICSITTGNKDTINKIDNGKYPFFVRSKDIKKINTFSYDGEAILTAGDGDICKIWHYIIGKFDYHQRVYMLYNFKNIHGRFLYYYISENFKHEVFKLSAKSTVDSLRLPMFQDFPILIPSLNEQTIIANYLDYKTDLVDTAIDKKQLLIKKLEEKRKSIINKAITKGLNPNMKLIDSGINWIGEIPEHWSIKKLKFIIKKLESGTSVNSSDESVSSEKEIGVLKTSSVFSYEFNALKNKKVIKEDLNRVKCSVKKDSIIISRMNTPELVGASGYVNKDFPNLFLPDRLWQTVFYKDVSIYVRYVSYILISDLYKKIISSKATGSSPSMKNLTKEDFLNTEICFSCKEEQKEIIEFLDNKTNKIDNLTSKIKVQIKQLKEYRQSIIFEAVTGKIDLRDWKQKK